MMVSTKGRYSLRLAIEVAILGADGVPVTMRQAAERQDLSVKYLEQLGGALVKAGVLRSIRGVSGGYLLARPAGEITAGDVLRATEGSCAPVACLEEGAAACPRRDECMSIDFWRGLDTVIENYVDGITLADLAKAR
ncbi:MAG: Rrf2 family transcriptional regulator [Gordonibacter sp.]|uniref:RrF2 family transcriptional regulator n=1 Tax=Gordonibacter sp. TaxID=1968902 RepID=UPI002FC87366